MRIFKKPLFWVVFAAVIAAAAGAVIWVAIPSARFPKNAAVRIMGMESDEKGVAFEVKDIHAEKDSLRFDLRWKNDSAGEISFGESFELYKSENGEWVKMQPSRSVGYPEILYVLNCDSFRDQSFDITAAYDLVAGEKYRLTAEFYVVSDSDSAERKYNWIDFEVTKDSSDDGTWNHIEKSYEREQWPKSAANTLLQICDRFQSDFR